MNKVIIFSAPSGSGKTTLVKHCLQKFPELQFSISCTTRAPRGEEQHEVDYYFLSPEEFRNQIKEEVFVEYEEVYENHYYGTLKSEVERIWSEGKTVIFDVDVQGGINLKKYFGDQALSIFIKPPSIEDLERRLVLRNTDDPEVIKMRISKANHELTFQDIFDEVVINDDLEKSKEEVDSLITEFLKK